ncbi:hypothetical protein AVEN_144089-1 [Araneus ventricosus]|uniref:Uncharacterized protein n=1 Tax=Araneus ventricosus TaxID=182803 RepID=A0A4Y2R6D4_ARAVE|nr:hypothetical protein AVEN_144089-1 [Araneus ventricosus]
MSRLRWKMRHSLGRTSQFWNHGKTTRTTLSLSRLHAAPTRGVWPITDGLCATGTDTLQIFGGIGSRKPEAAPKAGLTLGQRGLPTEKVTRA